MLSSQKILVAFRPRKFKPIRCCYAASNDSRARRAFRSGSVIWTTGDMDAETETPEPSHPWPYLKEMFMFTGSRNESFKFQCLNYLPQRKELLAFKNSPSNLKKHIERRHRSHLQRYMDLTATTTKRKGSLSVGEGPSTSPMKSVAAGSITAVLLVIIFLSAFLLIRRKMSSKQTAERPDNRTQLNMGVVHENPSAAVQRRPAEEQDDLCYASVSFSKHQEDPLYSNISPAQLNRHKNEEEEEEDSVEYTAVNCERASASPETRCPEDVEDPSALYSTVSKTARA